MPDESKVVVITGASGGIGAALALALAPEGHRLVLAARRGDELRRVAERATALGARGALPVETDVTRRADVERLLRAAVDDFGGVDVWVNNAGRGITRSVLELTDDDVDEMITVNVKSALYGMQAVVPHFVDRGRGHLINVSSFLGRVPVATFRSAYSAAKAALNSLTANLRMELRATHPAIHVSTVMPGVVTTDFARNVRGEPRPPIVGPPGAGGPPQTQTPEQVAVAIVGLIHDPKPELYTLPGASGIAARYVGDVGAFEQQMGGVRGT